MRSFFLFFVLLVLSSSLVLAISFSPTSLKFNLDKNQESCQNITVNSDTSMTVSDKWAENKDVVWNVNNFNTSASDHGISINYPQQAASGQSNVQVCLSGQNDGEFHGVVLLQQAQQGNSIIQLAIWVKAIISGSNEQPATSDQGSSNNQANTGSSNTGSGSQTSSDNTKGITDPKEQGESEKITSKAVQEINNKEKVTANAVNNIKETPKKKHYVLWTILGLLGLITVIILIIRTINIRKRRNKYGF